MCFVGFDKCGFAIVCCVITIITRVMRSPWTCAMTFAEFEKMRRLLLVVVSIRWRQKPKMLNWCELWIFSRKLRLNRKNSIHTQFSHLNTIWYSRTWDSIFWRALISSIIRRSNEDQYIVVSFIEIRLTLALETYLYLLSFHADQYEMFPMLFWSK